MLQGSADDVGAPSALNQDRMRLSGFRDQSGQASEIFFFLKGSPPDFFKQYRLLDRCFGGAQKVNETLLQIVSELFGFGFLINPRLQISFHTQ